MLQSITSAVTQLITMLGSVVTAVVGADGALADLLPVFALGVGSTVIMFGIRIIRGFTWGA